YVVWYTKDSSTLKYRQLFKELELGGPGATRYNYVESKDGTVRRIKKEEIFDNSLLPKGSRVFFKQGLTSRSGSEGTSFEIEFKGKKYKPTAGGWRTGKSGIDNLIKRNRIAVEGNRLTFKKYFDDFGYMAINNFWDDVSGGIASRTDPKIYVVQTSTKIVERCLLMATDPGDLVLDITCGAGTTAYVSEQWGRRWVTCDTSRVAITLAKQRLMTTNFDFYELAHKTEGIGSGLKYKSVPYVTLRTIANNEPPAEIILYDQPLINKEKTRITGPFTVESVPAPIAKSFDDLEDEPGSDTSIARSGETLRQAEWRDELLRAGVRAKGNAQIEFSRVEPLSGAKYIQAEAETKVKPPDKNLFEKDNQMSLEQRPQKVLVVFGPEHAPLEQRTVELALDEARYLKPDILLFCAFMFDEEAAKDIDETPEHLVGFKLLKAQMNMDLQTHDLKKKSGTNESFWLVGQPDVRVHKITKGEEKGKVQVEVMGFDYYNPKTGKVESGGKKNIAMWMLDTDYDGRSIFPSQVFFPMAGKKDGWAKLAKNLKAEIDEEKIEAFRGTKSLLFEPGKAIAVKIVDDRGIESLRVIKM
ncbi:MAG: hypothetical protein J5I98_13940, partial [Phaeodactylibacter sp.]|nr:hypothetical protein [Phaeodactylibacter sp.]